MLIMNIRGSGGKPLLGLLMPRIRYMSFNIYLDGILLEKVLLKDIKEQKSSLVFKSGTLNMLPHAVYIESFDGLLLYPML